MQISLENAQRIVSEISSVLGEDVNLMNQSAVIVASTDASRVGSHHRGAERIIADQLDRLIITPADQLPGVRPGLNLPVWVDGEIVGVLGITGNPATFTTPAHVLQKMTEILLRETRVIEDAQRYRRSSTRFLQTWLTDSRDITPDLIEEGRVFNIDVRARYIVAAAHVVAAGHRPATGAFQAEVDRVTDTLMSAAAAFGASTGMVGSRIILLFPLADGAVTAPESRMRAVHDWLASAAHSVRGSSAMRLAVGMSSGDASAPEATQEAIKALGYALRSPLDVHRFDELSLELLFAAIPERERTAFTRSVFRHIPPDGQDEARRSLDAYFESDGSLSRAAANLYVHKNTLNARLNRIAELTGLDPRRTADAAVLWLALQIDT